MTWVKLDDTFATHPKVIGLSAAAFRLHVEALVYAGQHLTDGVIPAQFVKGKAKALRELTMAGLWRDTFDGYVIHDFLVYNPSRESVEEDRRKARERRTKGGRTSGERRAYVARPSDDVHEPRPGPSRPDPEPPKAKARAASTKPTEDQTYLAAQISTAWGLTNGHLGPAAIQKLNTEYGVPKVTSSLRLLHGFPPEEAISSAYAYLVEMCRADT